MKRILFIIINVIPLTVLADDTLPKHPDFNRYQAMLNRSFAIERQDLATATPDCPKDLFVTNVACSGDDCVATLASATDKNFKEYLRAKRTDIQWCAPQ